MHIINSKTSLKNQQFDLLMTQWMGGKQQAFDQLVTEWKDPLVNYFYHHIQQLLLAEDLAQEVFIRVYRTKKYHCQGNFSSWLYRIAQNILRDHYRQRQLNTVSSSEFPDIINIASATKPQTDILLEQEQQRMVYQTLNKLSNEEQDLLVLSQIQGLSYQELADVTQVSLGVVKGKIYRAMQRFIKRFKEVNKHYA